MPRINRIRIINFSYNNDQRHILDETFNFHGGENALLSLANGGGKSVLVQLVLQPVVPETKIQGRRINAFFRKKRLPAYVLIEWKLDGAGGYLLTGIGLAAAEVSGIEDEKNRVKYFTFTSRYQGANAFDLANLELVKQNGSILEIKPFKEAREMMTAKEKKDPYLFGCFYDDDGERYRKRLAEFGIAQDEWKNIIAKINDSEGGLDEIFQKYKNSGQLLNEWIIKTIEKVIYKDRTQAHRLEEMLEGLVREVIENERFILEKQVLDEFLVGYGEQVGALVELLNGLEEQKRLAGKLAALNYFLNTETAQLQENQESNQQAMLSLKTELQHIDLEERSHEYWLRHEEHIQAARKLAEAEKSSKENEEKLEAAQLSAQIMQAAALNEDIRAKRADLSGINEKLAASRSQYDTDERMRNLEYSLKLLARATLEVLEQALERLSEEKKERGHALEQLKMDARNLDEDLRRFVQEEGGLQVQKKHFEAQEREVRDKLRLNLNRNLLGELDRKDIEKSRFALQKTLEDVRQRETLLAEEKTENARKQQEAERETGELQEAIVTQKNILNDLEREIAEYERQEQEVLGILRKYGFEEKLRFEQERLHTLFKQRLKNLDQSLEEAVRRRDEATESLSSLKNGRLHIPAEIVSLLASKDIPYDTGEAYLRNLAPDLRQKLLVENAVLPYALILAKENMEPLAQAMNNLTLRRVLPLIAYEDLGKRLHALTGRIVQAGAGLSLVCLYEGRIFDHESLVQLEEELKQKLAEALEQYAHYTGERNDTVAKQAVCARFSYMEEHLYHLEKKKTAAEEQLAAILSRVSQLGLEREDLRTALQELEQTSKKTTEDLQKAEAAVQLFEAWLEREKDYQACRKRLAEVSDEIVTADERKAGLTLKLEKAQEEFRSIDSDIKDKKREAQGIRNKLALYGEAPVAEIVEGTLEELESRLQALKKDYTVAIELLEKSQQDLKLECAKKEKELSKLGLAEDLYQDAVFDEGKAEDLRWEIKELQRAGRVLRELNLQAVKNAGAAEKACSIALEEVKKLGAESPLGPAEIKGDFPGRCRKLAAEQTRLEQEIKLISNKISDYRKLREQIAPILEGEKVEAEKSFQPEADLRVQTQNLTESFLTLATENRSKAENLKNQYNGLKTEYRERNANISNIFKGLDLLWHKTAMDYDEYYYLYERMVLHQEKLQELIKLHESQLSNLARNKKDMIQQCLLQGLRFYEEIEWISDHSKVRLQGRNRPVQMLKIDLSLDSSEAAGVRMTEYIEECIRKVREETRQEKSEADVKKTIAKLMNSRELLNIYLGYANIPVKVFKIDLNMQNSGLKTWEDAMHENSGGEKFVVYFSVLSALMSYTRSRTLEAAGAADEKDSSVLVLDNPFGPISSEHLLNPLFEIAKKHRTQLICLSDLKQNSIMNCFNLIYMLKIRSSAVGSNEYLKFEEFIRDESAIQNDERLEKAVFRVSEHQQIGLFE